MKSRFRKVVSILLTFVLVFTSFTMVSFGAAAKGKITVSKMKVTLEMNKSYQLKPKASSKSISKKGYQYRSSKQKVAVVSSKGKIIAKNLGKTTITIKSKAKPSVVKKVSVTVIKRKTNIIAMETGTAAKMKLTNKKVKNSQVKWTSSNKKVAKVYKNGVVKVVGNGSATISAKSKKLSGGKETFLIKGAKKVSTVAALTSAVEKKTKKILVAKDLTVTSLLRVPKGTEVILGKGADLKIDKSGRLINEGRISNVVKKVYIKRAGFGKMEEGTASDPETPPVDSEPPITTPENPENPDIENPPVVDPDDQEPENPEPPQEPEEPSDEVTEPEVPTDEALDGTEELNPTDEEGELEAEEEEEVVMEPESYVEVATYSDLVQSGQLTLKDGCTVIVGGQPIIGSKESGALMGLSQPADDGGPVAVWSYNGGGQLVLIVYGKLDIFTSQENVLGDYVIATGFSEDSDSTISPEIWMPTLNVLSTNTNLVISDGTLYVGTDKVVSKSDSDSVFNASNDTSFSEDNRVLFFKGNNWINAMCFGTVTVNRFYPGLMLQSSSSGNIYENPVPSNLIFNCDSSQWYDAVFSNHLPAGEGLYPIDINFHQNIVAYAASELAQSAKIEDAQPGQKVYFIPYSRAYTAIKYAKMNGVVMKGHFDSSWVPVYYEFTMPASGVWIGIETEEFKVYKDGQRIDGKPMNTFYFDTLDAAKEWYTGVQIEFSGVRYTVDFEWVKGGNLYGRDIYNGKIVCPELENDFSYLGHVPAFVTPSE